MSGKKYAGFVLESRGKMESFGKVKEESNDEGNVYWIAENFEEFWKMLKNYRN